MNHVDMLQSKVPAIHGGLDKDIGLLTLIDTLLSLARLSKLSSFKQYSRASGNSSAEGGLPNNGRCILPLDDLCNSLFFNRTRLVNQDVSSLSIVILHSVLSTKMSPVFPLSSFIPSCQPRCLQSFHCHPSFRLVNQDVSSLSIVILHSVLSTKMSPVFPLSSFIPSCQPRCLQSFHCHPSFCLVNQDVSSLSIVILHSVLSTKMSPVFPLSSFIPSCQPRCLQSFHCHPSFQLLFSTTRFRRSIRMFYTQVILS